jgi:protein tyrosine phosphatase (PTP) superfamily phosphohydrolase (DUF442 family)
MRIGFRGGILGVATCGLVLWGSGCNRAPQPAASSAPAAAPQSAASSAPAASPTAADELRLERIEVGAARPVHQIGRYYLAGQPASEDLAVWKDKGVRTIVSLRTPGEIDWDEKAAVEALGMKYVSIPFRGADSLGDEQIEAALAVLKEGDEQPILLHCGTSNRVGAIWYAHRIRNDGLSPEQALAEAKQVGLRSTELTDVVDAYCETVPDSP